MNSPLTNISSHHDRMKQTFADLLERFEGEEKGSAREELVQFLKREVVPHAVSEENVLYPEADEIVREHGRPTASMSVDHEWIENEIREIVDLLRDASGSGTGGELQARLGALYTVFSLHLDKEETVLVPLLEEHLDDSEKKNLMDRLSQDFQDRSRDASPEEVRNEKSSVPEENENIPELDVRDHPPAERHEKIFEQFENLEPGEAFILVNDHDPEPLYYQFEAEREGTFDWTYLQEGPEAWRVKISKTAPSASS